MTRVAVIGANGQVGAELCLMLAQRPGIELVPICRNRSGSAFLRWQGIACRHGKPAVAQDAPRLIGDCDVIVNSSLATGTPAQIRRIEDGIVRNLFEHSPPDACIIHFSTQSIYGDPARGRVIRWTNPYGRVKLATESRVRNAARKSAKRAYILRLGHVCGNLQEISAGIRADILADRVVLAAEDCSSNTVHTAAIIGAIEQILAGAVPPGTYDLMNSPRWTWREVYEYEAAQVGLPLQARIAPPPSARAGAGRRLRMALASAAAAVATSGPIRNLGAKLFAHVPERANARAMAWWYARRAGAEINALQRSLQAPDHMTWVENGRHFFPASYATSGLLRELPAAASTPRSANSWVQDLPDAGASGDAQRSRLGNASPATG